MELSGLMHLHPVIKYGVCKPDVIIFFRNCTQKLVYLCFYASQSQNSNGYSRIFGVYFFNKVMANHVGGNRKPEFQCGGRQTGVIISQLRCDIEMKFTAVDIVYVQLYQPETVWKNSFLCLCFKSLHESQQQLRHVTVFAVLEQEQHTNFWQYEQ